jgi:hypothetical protein
MADETAPNTLPAGHQYFMPVGSGHGYGRWEVTQPVGHTFEDLLRPEYWSHHARKLGPDPMTGRKSALGSILEIRTEDHSYYAELYVRDVADRALDVRVSKEPIPLGIQGEVETRKFKTRLNASTRKKDIIRKVDGVVVGSAPTNEAAKDWIDKTENEKAMA